MDWLCFVDTAVSNNNTVDHGRQCFVTNDKGYHESYAGNEITSFRQYPRDSHTSVFFFFSCGAATTTTTTTAISN
jgi:hypothetical protein